MCRHAKEGLEYFLVHPGGPYFSNKDLGSWSIPKGLVDQDEPLLKAAKREFQEETGIEPQPPFHPLGEIRQKGGKKVHAWAFLGNWDAKQGFTSNTFSLEWPPRSGRMQEFPEIDNAQWFDQEQAKSKILSAQIPFLDEASKILL